MDSHRRTLNSRPPQLKSERIHLLLHLEPRLHGLLSQIGLIKRQELPYLLRRKILSTLGNTKKIETSNRANG